MKIMGDFVFPAFEDVPLIEGLPQGYLWGFYDKDGKKDELGGMRCIVLAAAV